MTVDQSVMSKAWERLGGDFDASFPFSALKTCSASVHGSLHGHFPLAKPNHSLHGGQSVSPNLPWSHPTHLQSTSHAAATDVTWKYQSDHFHPFSPLNPSDGFLSHCNLAQISHSGFQNTIEQSIFKKNDMRLFLNSESSPVTFQQIPFLT